MSFHGFLYGAYLPQNLAMALLLYTLVVVGRPASPLAGARSGRSSSARPSSCIPFTGALLCALVTTQAVVWAAQRRRGWLMGPGCLAAASSWPRTGRPTRSTGRWRRPAFAAAGSSRCASSWPCSPGSSQLRCRWAQCGHGPQSPASTARGRAPLAGVGFVAVVSIAILQVVEFTIPHTDPVDPRATGWSSTGSRIAGGGRSCCSPGLWASWASRGSPGGGACPGRVAWGMPRDRHRWCRWGWPSPCGGGSCCSARCRSRWAPPCGSPPSKGGWTRRIVVGVFAASLVFRVVTLLALPPTITYLNTPLQTGVPHRQAHPEDLGTRRDGPLHQLLRPRVLQASRAHRHQGARRLAGRARCG